MTEFRSLGRRTRSMWRKTHTTEETKARCKTIKRRKAQPRSVKGIVQPRITYFDLPREIRHRILKLALKTDAFHGFPRHAPPVEYTQGPRTSPCHEPPGSHSSAVQYARVWNSLAHCRHRAHLEDLAYFLQPVLEDMETILIQWLAVWSTRGGKYLAHLDDKGCYVCVWYRHPNKRLEASGPLSRHRVYVGKLIHLSAVLDGLASDLGLEFYSNKAVTRQLRDRSNLDGKSKCTMEKHALGRQVYCIEAGNAYWCSIWL